MKRHLILLTSFFLLSACGTRDTYDLPAHVPVSSENRGYGQGQPNKDYKLGYKMGRRDGRKGYQDYAPVRGSATFQAAYRDGFDSTR